MAKIATNFHLHSFKPPNTSCTKTLLTVILSLAVLDNNMPKKPGKRKGVCIGASPNASYTAYAYFPYMKCFFVVIVKFYILTFFFY